MRLPLTERGSVGVSLDGVDEERGHGERFAGAGAAARHAETHRLVPATRPQPLRRQHAVRV